MTRNICMTRLRQLTHKSVKVTVTQYDCAVTIFYEIESKQVFHVAIHCTSLFIRHVLPYFLAKHNYLSLRHLNLKINSELIYLKERYHCLSENGREAAFVLCFAE